MARHRLGGCNLYGDGVEYWPFPCEARDYEVPDSSPDSEPPAPLPIKSNWALIMEFTAADIFQHSPFGDILSSLKYLSLSGEP